MTAEQDTGLAPAAVMAAADVGCRIGPAVGPVADPRTCCDNTSLVQPDSSLDNDRSPPLPVLVGPGFPRLSGGLVKGSLASWDRWTKRPK